jgi:hypothetical protein
MEKLSKEIKGGIKDLKFSMNIPREIHREFLIQTTIDGIDMKDVLMDAIYQYLRKHKRI